MAFLGILVFSTFHSKRNFALSLRYSLLPRSLSRLRAIMPPGIPTRPIRPPSPAAFLRRESVTEVTVASPADVTAYLRKRKRNPEDIYYEDPMAGPDTHPPPSPPPSHLRGPTPPHREQLRLVRECVDLSRSVPSGFNWRWAWGDKPPVPSVIRSLPV